MKRRSWKHFRANSLIAALRGCKDFALDRANLSVERIADRMGVTHDALYKWLATGRMPAVLIPAYEHACGCAFVSRWLAASAGHVVIDIPTGRIASDEELHALQSASHDAIGALMAFYKGAKDAEETLGAIAHALEQFAWHDTNVRKHAQPELELA